MFIIGWMRWLWLWHYFERSPIFRRRLMSSTKVASRNNMLRHNETWHILQGGKYLKCKWWLPNIGWPQNHQSIPGGVTMVWGREAFGHATSSWRKMCCLYCSVCLVPFALIVPPSPLIPSLLHPTSVCITMLVLHIYSMLACVRDRNQMISDCLILN